MSENKLFVIVIVIVIVKYLFKLFLEMTMTAKVPNDFVHVFG